MARKRKSKPDNPLCYQCEHRGTIIGDAHSRCRHPSIDGSLAENQLANAIAGLFGNMMHGRPPAKIGQVETSFSETGIRGGWAAWPFNFDPVWLEWCTGFKKESK